MNKKKHPQVKNTPAANPERVMIICSTSSKMASGVECAEPPPPESSVWLEAFIDYIRRAYNGLFIVNLVH